jgi:hypothetical protein
LPSAVDTSVFGQGLAYNSGACVKTMLADTCTTVGDPEMRFFGTGMVALAVLTSSVSPERSMIRR